MKSYIVYATVFILSGLGAHFHMIYTADSLAKWTGYFVSLWVFPVIIGIAFSCVGIIVLGEELIPGAKKLWLLPMLGALGSLLPILNDFWRM